MFPVETEGTAPDTIVLIYGLVVTVILVVGAFWKERKRSK